MVSQVADLTLGLPRLPGKLPLQDLTPIWRDGRNFDLDDRIWSNRLGARESIDRILRDGIASGASIDDVADELIRYVRPTYAPYGGGRAQYAANRLANNEMRRAHSLSERQVSMTDPLGGFLKFRTAATHIHVDPCTEIANEPSEHGRGVYPADECPLPPIHVGCRCEVEQVQLARTGMDDVVEGLRVEYGLADPTDMTPAELAVFRRETAGYRQDAQLMVRGWLEQTGTVSRGQMAEPAPSVQSWIASVRAEKRRRRP